MRERAVPVLVHSPLVGPSTWEPVAALLGKRGHAPVVPSLTAVLDGGAPYYRRLSAVIAAAIDRHVGDGPVVLVGHSGAGALLPAVADATSAAVAGAVFVDAVLPHPGRSWFATVPPEMREQLAAAAQDGLLPPWHEWFPPGTVEALLPDADQRSRFCAGLHRVPLAYFEEPAPDLPDLSPSHSAYLQLSEAYTAEADRAERDGSRTIRRKAHHLAVLTEPHETAAALEELIDGCAH